MPFRPYRLSRFTSYRASLHKYETKYHYDIVYRLTATRYFNAILAIVQVNLTNSTK